jgi:hypothetical protein
LEREVRTLRAKVQTVEMKVDAVDKDMQGIPGLIKAEFRLVDSRFARVMAELADLRTNMDDRFDAVLRAVSETIAERDERS